MADEIPSWLAEMIKPVEERGQRLVTEMADDVAAGRTQAAVPKAQELGSLVGRLAARMFTYEKVLEDFAEADPNLRGRIADLIRSTPLPSYVPSRFADHG